MTTATATPTASFLDHAGRAVIAWLQGMLRATPAALAASHGSSSLSVPSYYKVGVRMALLREADEVEAALPHHAAELRKQAAAI
jgi:uncharacterized membrane protein